MKYDEKRYDADYATLAESSVQEVALEGPPHESQDEDYTTFKKTSKDVERMDEAESSMTPERLIHGVFPEEYAIVTESVTKAPKQEPDHIDYAEKRLEAESSMFVESPLRDVPPVSIHQLRKL
ncbi:hypothetical protein KIN20_021857 [Parelaphostrongylus tenuis]|uniref:Uncharacterized protein n=1 Tax=Parelaphostrongylus tenuis TaxID=148309 RepID=A0AAD5QUT4_PARTN|nr:hypothetical protein KIN20_021857 [Parelaphostrongylus tenuis]